MRPEFVDLDVRNVYNYGMRDPGEDDGRLVAAAQNGDRQAFELLYHRYKLDAWNLAYLTLRNRQDAEDAVQETFVKAMLALRSTTNVEAVRPWLLTICRNVCLDRLRWSRRRPTVPLDDQEVADPAAVADPDRHVDFGRALQTMRPKDREAFLLVDVLGCRSHEAASILGLHASSTLRSRLTRARQHMASAVSSDSEPAAGAHAEIWGLYHHPPDSVIVASFQSAERDAQARAAFADLICRLENHARSGVLARNGVDLVEFFERLEDRIPSERRVIAVIDDRPAHAGDGAQRWLADHSRWQVRRPATHTSWLLEVQALLRAAGTEPARRSAGGLGGLDACTPFLWVHGR
jgi:RNA polymerase sigma-70 factor (ECF subfamily)